MPYSGINILMLWASAIEQGFGSPSWMTFQQAIELKACVRKGEKGSLVVYANSVTKTEQNDAGEDVERDIHFLKGYTVFNCRSDRGLARAVLREAGAEIHPLSSASRTRKRFSPAPAPISATGAARPTTRRNSTTSRCRRLRAFTDAESFYATLAHETMSLDETPVAA